MTETKSMIRTDKANRPYAVLDKGFIHDPRLSARAVGVMTRLLAHSDNWKIYANYLYNNYPDGRDAIYTTFRELRKFGYLELVVIRDNRGRFLKQEYRLHEEASTESKDPLYNPDGNKIKRKKIIRSKPVTDNAEMETVPIFENPQPDKQKTGKSLGKQPFKEKPEADMKTPKTPYPDVADPSLVSNDLYIYNNNNNKKKNNKPNNEKGKPPQSPSPLDELVNYAESIGYSMSKPFIALMLAISSNNIEKAKERLKNESLLAEKIIRQEKKGGQAPPISHIKIAI